MPVTIPTTDRSPYEYSASYAPCLPFGSSTSIYNYFRDNLNAVGQQQFINQIFQELCHCAYYNSVDSNVPKPKYADHLPWLAGVFKYCWSATNGSNSEQLRWLSTYLINHTDQTPQPYTPSFLCTKLGRLKEQTGFLFHLYRFQLEVRAKRVLTAARFRHYKNVEGINLSHHTISWNMLERLNIQFELYPQPIAVCRRNTNVVNLCNRIPALLNCIEAIYVDLFGWAAAGEGVLNSNRSDFFNWVTRQLGGRTLEDTQMHLFMGHPNQMHVATETSTLLSS